MSLFSDFDKHLSPKERLHSQKIQEHTTLLSTDVSYRDTESYLNRFLHREGSDSFHHRTIADNIEASGVALSKVLDEHAREILIKNDFNPDTACPNHPENLPKSITAPNMLPNKKMKKLFREKILEYNAKHGDFPIGIVPTHFLPIDIERRVIYISVDDVLVKRQKDARKSEEKDKKVNVANTVIHIQVDGKLYIITAVGITEAFRILVAFLLENNLFEGRQLIFMSDGAKEIKGYAHTFFSWRPYVLILDWFHLAKRIKELISMCLKMPKDKKGPIIKKILNFLWVGNTKGAIAYIESFKRSIIKNEDVHNEMVAYIQRKKENICCHALRREFKLRLSSNTAEKSNDLVVADRQKHNGMSWSYEGSGALALLSATRRNNALSLWITERKVSLNLKEVGQTLEGPKAA